MEPAPALLPWYDFPVTRPILDKVWHQVRNILTESGYPHLPKLLDRHSAYLPQVCAPKLVLGQCCGLDLFLPPLDQVVPIAAPVIPSLATAPGSYYSYIAKPKGMHLPNRLELDR